MESNETLIVICRRLIETSLNWGDPSSWTNEDFEQLSERIFEKTTVRLSVSTLKRIWGKVRYENSPTTATLNALARFAGFAGWREFQQRQAGASVSIPPGGRDRPSSLASIPATASVPVTGPRRRLFMTTVIVSTAVLTGLRPSSVPGSIPDNVLRPPATLPVRSIRPMPPAFNSRAGRFPGICPIPSYSRMMLHPFTLTR